MREHVRPSQTHAEEVVANASGENFPVALRLLPARHRRHLTNLYFFARLTDDLGDEARDGSPDQADVTALRLRLLDELADPRGAGCALAAMAIARTRYAPRRGANQKRVAKWALLAAIMATSSCAHSLSSALQRTTSSR